MSKTLLIIQREFSTRVKKKSFIILTVLMPFIFAALVFVPIWLAGIEDNDQKAVAIYDATNHYLTDFKDSKSYRFVPIADPDNPSYYSDSTQYEAVVVIRENLATHPDGITIFSPRQVQDGLLSYVQNVVNERVRCDKLAATDIDGIEKIIDDVQSEVTVSTKKRNAEGKEAESSTDIAIAAGMVLTLLIYMFVMTYGGMVMQGVMEEKTNRIVELMVSSVKPFQLLAGKIVGVALVGFVQLAIWGVMFFAIIAAAGVLFGVAPDVSSQTAMTGAASPISDAPAIAAQGGGNEMLAAITNLPFLEMAVLFVLYFIGGYLLYASFFAAIGASVNEQEDSSQFMMPMVLIMVFGLYAAMGSVQNTDGPLAFWASLFPLTSPIVMMVRVPFSVPLWQEILSISILYATAILFVWISGRIYRVGILMYGKKPSVKEMLKWMRYK